MSTSVRSSISIQLDILGQNKLFNRFSDNLLKKRCDRVFFFVLFIQALNRCEKKN